jgi:hypothetical protein
LQTLDESLYANLDVTTHALSWNVLLLAENIEAQRELRQEVLSALENEASESYERYIDRDDTFLAACVLESARLRPILREHAHTPRWNEHSLMYIWQHFPTLNRRPRIYTWMAISSRPMYVSIRL